MATTKRNYATLLIVGRTGELLVPRRYAQSTSGFSSSHRTAPPDSRSIEIASAEPQGLCFPATFVRCPSVVLHRSANFWRSARDIGRRKVLRSMRSDYHHTVSFLATPNGEFHRKVYDSDNLQMAYQEIRRANLRVLIATKFRDNQSSLAKRIGKTGSYINDLVREGSSKSFGEKAARDIESKVGLLPNQLDIPNSPLRYDPSRQDLVDDKLEEGIDGLSPDEKAELLDRLAEIVSKRKQRRRK